VNSTLLAVLVTTDRQEGNYREQYSSGNTYHHHVRHRRAGLGATGLLMNAWPWVGLAILIIGVIAFFI
jgi:hypothetical protein